MQSVNISKFYFCKQNLNKRTKKMKRLEEEKEYHSVSWKLYFFSVDCDDD